MGTKPVVLEPHAHRRLCRPVPTLVAIAGRGTRAFTLVELLIAVALSAVIIITAVSCFRMVAHVISTANALSTENSLLRSGLLLSLQDVDYWHSHADDKPPYNKQFMRLPQTLDDPATATPENAWRRPFQPVRFAPRTDTAERDPFPAEPAPVTGTARDSGYYNADPAAAKLPTWDQWITDDYWNEPYNRSDYVPNPNMVLAHDPRSICRVPVAPTRVPVAKINNYNDIYDNSGNIYLGTKHYGGFRAGYPRLIMGDYTLVGATDMRDVPGVSARYPIGATPQVVSQIEFPEALGTPGTPLPGPQTYTDTVNTTIPIDVGAQMYQPLMWSEIWQRLSYYGMYEYMTPGTALMFSDRNGRTLDNASVPLPPYTYRSSGATWYTYVLTDDYSFNIGNQDLAVRMGERFIASRPIEKNRNSRPYRSTTVLPLRPCWPYMDVGSLDQGDFDTFSYQFPFTIFLGTGEYDYDVNSEKANMQFWWLTGGNVSNIERGSMARSDQMSLSTTVWLPFNATDAERCDPAGGTALAPTSSAAIIKPLDYTSKPEHAPIMRTSIMRYGRLCGTQDVTVTIVAVEDPLTGKKTEMSCMPFGTTFRGARQHWRLYSPALTETGPIAPGQRFGVTDNHCIGDFYDTAKGPYAP